MKMNRPFILVSGRGLLMEYGKNDTQNIKKKGACVEKKFKIWSRSERLKLLVDVK